MTSIEEKLGSRLRKLAKNRNARTLLLHLEQRYTNNMRCTYVDNLARRSGLSDLEVRGVLGKLEHMKLGTLILGRRGKRTRFEWSAPLTMVARAAVGTDAGFQEDIDLDDASWLNEAIDDDENDLALVEDKDYPIPLGDGRFARLLLPSNHSGEDIEKVRSFLRLFD